LFDDDSRFVLMVIFFLFDVVLTVRIHVKQKSAI